MIRHKYNKNDILYFKIDNKKIKVKILEQFHLIYKNKYPSYKIQFLEDYYYNEDMKRLGLKQEKSIAPECMLSDK